MSNAGAMGPLPRMKPLTGPVLPRTAMAPGPVPDDAEMVGGSKRCTAKSKRSQVRCKGVAVAQSPNQRCRMHGGNAQHAIGTANPGFKHGRYSKYLPADMDRLYTEALSNPDLLEMADHLALLESRMKSILSQSAEGEPVPRWSQVKEIADGLITQVVSGGKAEDVMEAAANLSTLLDAGAKWDRTWDQVQDTMEQLRKVADTEIKRKKELHQMVPIERVMILVAAVGQAVKRNVTDPEQVAAVYKELATLHGTNQAPGANGNGNRRLDRVGPEVVDVTPRPSNGRTRPRLERRTEVADGAR